jgi:D-glycero-alpha-D-manno-heptose-7-phosphate kinase
LVSACGLILTPEEREGLELSFSSPVAPGSGLGASSALVVAMTKALSVYSGNELSKSNLAIEAFNIERNHMKISGGFQDEYSSAHGSLNFLECKNEKINVENISTSRDFILELESNLILADLSLPRTGQHIIEDQQKKFPRKKDKNGRRYEEAIRVRLSNARCLSRRKSPFDWPINEHVIEVKTRL